MATSTSTARSNKHPDARSPAAGSQSLLRGPSVIEAIASGPMRLPLLAEQLGLTRSTTHYLASALGDSDYLAFTLAGGYRLGPKLMSLGVIASIQTDMVQVARPHLAALSASTRDTVQLGVISGDSSLRIGIISGSRAANVACGIGDRHGLTATGAGMALMLDQPESFWSALLSIHQPALPDAARASWIARMRDHVAAQCACDAGDDPDQVRSVAAGIRDAHGNLIAAISVSSAAHNMIDERIPALSEQVRATARAIEYARGRLEPTLGDK